MKPAGPVTAAEEPLEIPLERLNPDTLRNMIVEFVTREWEDFSGPEHTLDDKVEQVLRQLKAKKAKIVFDCTTKTWNIMPSQ
jgi:hypothetical protein